MQAACGASSSHTEPENLVEIRMQERAFRPATVSISTGTTVRWVNQDDASHTVTAGTRAAPGQTFDQSISPGETFEYTFNDPGRYEYFCRIHPAMQGQITVQ